MSTTIRAADPKDAPALVELWRVAGAEPTHTDDADSVIRLLAYDPQAIIVAEANDHIVGSIIAAWDGWRGSLYRLVVLPSHRRRVSVVDWFVKQSGDSQVSVQSGFRPSSSRPTSRPQRFGEPAGGRSKSNGCASSGDNQLAVRGSSYDYEEVPTIDRHHSAPVGE
jgi:hypothetical protein